jgi:hypothetical protein
MTALLFTCRCSYLTENTYLHGLLRGSPYFLHVDVRTSQETHVFTAYYGDYEEEREVGSSERHYGWGEQNISSVFEGSQELPVCPSGKYKLLTGTIEV